MFNASDHSTGIRDEFSARVPNESVFLREAIRLSVEKWTQMKAVPLEPSPSEWNNHWRAGTVSRRPTILRPMRKFRRPRDACSQLRSFSLEGCEITAVANPAAVSGRHLLVTFGPHRLCGDM